MGSIYRRKWKDKNGILHKTGVWWIKYYQDGRPIRESSESTKESDAKKLLKIREADVVKGLPVIPRVTRITFQELAEAVIADYEINEQRSLPHLKLRFKKHILPVFGTRRAVSITATDVEQYAQSRRETGASNGTINRELTAIRRAFCLAAKNGRIFIKPNISLLKENNTRNGFFEREQFEAVRRHLPAYLKPVASVAYITGWRIQSELLTLQWPQVDFLASELRLHAGTTKNDEARVFPFTSELRRVLEAQYSDTQHLQRKKAIFVPYVFHKDGRRIQSFRKAWARACYDAGLPCVVHPKRDSKGEIVRYKDGPKKSEPVIERIEARAIPHDFRRTAVRNLVRAGVPERVAMKMTGHKTREVFERYNIVSPGDLVEAARKLDAAADVKFATGTVPGTVENFPTNDPLLTATIQSTRP